MSNDTTTISDVSAIVAVISAVVAAFWGIYVFNKQQRFKRLQNLSQIFQRFADSENSFLELFALCDEAYISPSHYDQDALATLFNTPVKEKLQYLALLEEVALYASYSEVDRNYAEHLFQWHFYYIYSDPKISEAFWGGPGGGLGGVDEINKPYWKYQLQFAKGCNPTR